MLMKIARVGFALGILFTASIAGAVPAKTLTAGVICEANIDCEMAIERLSSAKGVLLNELGVDLKVIRSAKLSKVICPGLNRLGSRIPAGLAYMEELGFEDLDMVLLASTYPSKCPADLHDLMGVLGQSPVATAWVKNAPHLLNIRFTGRAKGDRETVIHEIGHFLGALHDDSGIMVPYANNLKLGRKYFSVRSLWEISAHKARASLSLKGG